MLNIFLVDYKLIDLGDQENQDLKTTKTGRIIPLDYLKESRDPNKSDNIISKDNEELEDEIHDGNSSEEKETSEIKEYESKVDLMEDDLIDEELNDDEDISHFARSIHRLSSSSTPTSSLSQLSNGPPSSSTSFVNSRDLKIISELGLSQTCPLLVSGIRDVSGLCEVIQSKVVGFSNLNSSPHYSNFGEDVPRIVVEMSSDTNQQHLISIPHISSIQPTIQWTSPLLPSTNIQDCDIESEEGNGKVKRKRNAEIESNTQEFGIVHKIQKIPTKHSLSSSFTSSRHLKEQNSTTTTTSDNNQNVIFEEDGSNKEGKLEIEKELQEKERRTIVGRILIDGILPSSFIIQIIQNLIELKNEAQENNLCKIQLKIHPNFDTLQNINIKQLNGTNFKRVKDNFLDKEFIL